MARATMRFALVFGMAVAMAVTILSITTWAGPPDSQGEQAGPIPPKDTIYRPEQWTVF